MTKTILMSPGQALSTWPFTASNSESSTAIFQDTRANGGVHPIQIQGFYWDGTATIAVKDYYGVTLYDGSNAGKIWPNDASGSIGLVVNAPLYVTTTGGTGGSLIVFGKVL